MASSQHDLQRYILTFAGQRLPPDTESGGQFVRYTFPDETETTETTGSGGVVVVKRASTGTAVVRISKHAEAHRILGLRWRTQQAAKGVTKIPEVPLTGFDPTNGDETFATGHIQAAPSQEVADAPGFYEWTLGLTNIRRDYGALVPIGGGSA